MAKRTAQAMMRIPTPVRDRLRSFGVKGQTFGEIVSNLMDTVNYERFMAEQYARLEEARRDPSTLTHIRDL